MAKIAVGILGATGTVGQRFIQLLENHPTLQVVALGASPRSAGKPYYEAVSWKLSTEIPQAQQTLLVTTCDPKHFSNCRIIFSGLDSDVAGEIEEAFMLADFCVFSNAKNHRAHPLVPLCVPLVNPDHMDIIHHQRNEKGISRGFIVTNANCSTTGLVVALKALQNAFGALDSVMVTTLQAISGAGYPGVPSLDMLDNVIPYISGEEDKLETEPLKILGTLNPENTLHIHELIKISACCNRVAVIDGHTEAVCVSFVKRPAPSVEDIKAVLSSYIPPYNSLFMSPPNAIIVRNESNRPQPKLDRDAGKGQAITVGRIRNCNILDVKFTLLSHNTVLGAAGSSILNAEIAIKKGLVV